MSTTLGDAFIELHAQGTALPAEIQAQASAGAQAAETTITKSLAEAGTVGGRVAGEAIEEGVEGGAERGMRSAWAEITEGAALAGASAGVVLREELAVAGREAGDAAGDAAGRQIFSGIAKGGAAGAAALKAELAGASLGVGGRFGDAFGRGILDLSPALAIAGGATAAFAVGIGLAANEALQAEKENAKLTQSLLNNASAATIGYEQYQKLAASIQDLTGVEDEQVLAAASTLTQFQLTGEQIEEILPLVADYAARTGQDMPSAAQNLGRALLGNTRALKAVGINYTATGDRATDFANIMDALEEKVGGFAENQAQLLDGQLRKLKSNFGDIGESIGGFFLPGLTKAAEAMNFGADAAAEEGRGISVLDGVLTSVLPTTALFNAGMDLMNRGQKETAAVLQSSAQAIGTWGQQLRAGKIDTDQYNSRLDNLVASAKELGLSEADVAAILKSGKGEMRAYAREVLGLAGAHNVASVAARQQQLAQLALAGGYVGIAANMQSLRDAQRGLAETEAKLAKLRERGKEGTEAWAEAQRAVRDANLQVFSSGVALTDSVGKYAVQLKQEGASAKEVRETVRELGEEYGLNRGAIQNLIQDTERYIGTQKDILGTVDTVFRAPGLAETLRDAIRLKDVIAGIRDVGNIVAPGSGGTDGGGNNNGGNGGGNRGNGGNNLPNPPQQGGRVLYETSIELDGKTIYESGEAVGRRQRIRFSGRDDG